MLKDLVLLALSNLKHRGIRSWLTMLGIFIGIAAVVSLISLGTGLQNAITAQFSSLSTDRLTIQNAGTGFGPPGSTSVRKLTTHDIDVISSVKGIDVVVDRLIRIVRVEYNNQVNFNYVADIPDDQKKVKLIYDSMNVKAESGRLLQASDRGKVVIGSDIASEKTNGFNKQIQVGSTLTIQGKKFTVIGILQKASTFQINAIILMSSQELRDILNIPKDETDIIVVKVLDKNQIEQVANDIEQKLRKDRHEKEGEEDFQVQTPIQALGTVNTILNIINLVVTGIAAISLLVGAIGITNTMYTSVLERTREIGVMKAIGARNQDVLFVFLFEAGFLGLVGGIVGAAIGIGLAFAVQGAAAAAFGTSILNVQISYPLLFSAIAFSFLLGIFSGLLPALQASRLKPVEALRQ